MIPLGDLAGNHADGAMEFTVLVFQLAKTWGVAVLMAAGALDPFAQGAAVVAREGVDVELFLAGNGAAQFHFPSLMGFDGCIEIEIRSGYVGCCGKVRTGVGLCFHW